MSYSQPTLGKAATDILIETGQTLPWCAGKKVVSQHKINQGTWWYFECIIIIIGPSNLLFYHE